MTINSAEEIFNCSTGSPKQVERCELDKGREFMAEKGTDNVQEPYSKDNISDETADLGAFALETIAKTGHDIDDVEEVTRDITGGHTFRKGVQQLKFKNGDKFILKNDNDRDVAYTQQARHITEKLGDESTEVVNLRCNSDNINGHNDCRMALTNSGISMAATGIRKPLEEMDEMTRNKTKKFLANQHQTGKKVVTQALLGEFDRNEGLGKRGETISSFDFEMQAKNVTLMHQRTSTDREIEDLFYDLNDFTTFYDGGTKKVIQSLDRCGGIDKLIDAPPTAMCNVANRDFNKDFKSSIEESMEIAEDLVDGQVENGVAPTVLDGNGKERIQKLRKIINGSSTEIR